jgi:hypothetical protein
MVQCSVRRTSIRARGIALTVTLLALIGSWLVAPTGAQSAAVEVGYRDFSYSTSITAPTGQKPESKLWYNDGTWWGVLWNAGVSPKRLEIYRFNRSTQATNAWTPTGTVVDSRRNSEADVLWSGGKLYVLTHMKDTDTTATDLGLKFQRFGYSTTSKTYAFEVTKTVVNKKAEAAVLDRDSTGKLWVTYTTENTSGGREVRVAHSTTSDITWVAPYVLPASGANNLSLDDIATLVAYKDPREASTAPRRIGVLWSNESAGTANGLYFASHKDGSDDSTASWAGVKLCSSTLCPDDHLNIKSIDADASGNVYAAVKTSKNDASSPVATDPLIVVYRLSSTGWTSRTVWQVQDDVTRVIILLDSTNHEAYLFGAGPCCSGGTVYTKHAPLGTLAFPTGKGTPFIKSSADPKINNVTSTKQTVNSTTGLLVVAGDDSTRFYVHNFLTLAGAATTATLNTTADTYVDSANPAKVFGTGTAAWVDNSPVNIGYLKFDLSPYAGKTITAATLKVRTTSSSSAGSGGTTTVRQVSDDSWTEGGLTYNTRKALGTTTIGSLAAPSAISSSYSTTLTPSALQGDVGSTLSLGLTTTSSDGVGLGTREAAAGATLQLTFK